MIFDLVNDFADVLEAMPADHPRYRILMLLDEAIRRDVHFINRHPTTLFQCMWNTCWWYDCEEAEQHYDNETSQSRLVPGFLHADLRSRLRQLTSRLMRAGSSPLAGSTAGQAGPLQSLIESWRADRRRARTSAPWLRSRRPPSIPLDSPLMTVFEGVVSGKESVAFLQHGQEVAVSIGRSVTVWDVRTSSKRLTLGSRNGVDRLSLSPNERWLATSSDWLSDKTSLALWDLWTPTARPVKVRVQDGVRCVSFSPDSEFIACCLDANTVRACALTSNSPDRLYRGHSSNVRCLACSPDGSLLAAGTEDGSIHLWDAASGRMQLSLQAGSYPIDYVWFTPGNAALGSIARHGAVRIQDIHTGRLRARYHALTGCAAYCTTPSGSHVVTASWSGTIRIWDAITGKKVRSFPERHIDVNCVAISPDASLIASGAENGTVRAYSATPAASWAILGRHDASVRSLAVSPDGTRIVSGAADGSVRVWNAARQGRLAELQRHEADICSLELSPDRHSVVTGAQDGSLCIWNVRNGVASRFLSGHSSSISCLAVSSDGAVLASGSRDTTIRLWERRAASSAAVLRGHTSDVTELAFSQDAKWIASRGGDDTIRLWHLPSNSQHFLLHKPPVGQCYGAISDDGTVEVVCSDTDRDSAIDVLAEPANVVSRIAGCFESLVDWFLGFPGGHLGRARRRKKIGVLSGHRDIVTDVVVSADNTRIASASEDGTVRLWDTRSCEQLRVFKAGRPGIIGPGYRRVATSPRGTRLATLDSNNRMRLWDADSGAVLAEASGSETASGVFAFLPDGTTLAVCSPQNTIELWDIKSGAKQGVLDGLNASVTCITVSSDGSHIAAATGDDALRVWNAKSREAVAAFDTGGQTLRSIAFSPDGRKIAGSTSVWNLADVMIWDLMSHKVVYDFGHQRQQSSTGRPRREQQWRAVSASELHIEVSVSGATVAWYPGALSHTLECGEGIWAGARAHHITLLELADAVA